MNVKQGDHMILSEEVKQAQDPVIKTLGRAGDEIRIWKISGDEVFFKYVWDSMYGTCSIEEAEAMKAEWEAKRYPALRTGPEQA